MTARELIEVLSKLDPDLRVFTVEDVSGHLEVDEVKVEVIAHRFNGHEVATGILLWPKRPLGQAH